MTTNFNAMTKYVGSKLYLYGENLDPQQVEDMIGFSATKLFRKGDQFSAGKHIRTFGMWNFDLSVTYRTISDDLVLLFKRIPDEYKPLLNLDRVDSARISLMFQDSSELRTESPRSFEIELDASDIDIISELGAQLYITYMRY